MSAKARNNQIMADEGHGSSNNHENADGVQMQSFKYYTTIRNSKLGDQNLEETFHARIYRTGEDKDEGSVSKVGVYNRSESKVGEGYWEKDIHTLRFLGGLKDTGDQSTNGSIKYNLVTCSKKSIQIDNKKILVVATASHESKSELDRYRYSEHVIENSRIFHPDRKGFEAIRKAIDTELARYKHIGCYEGVRIICKAYDQSEEFNRLLSNTPQTKIDYVPDRARLKYDDLLSKVEEYLGKDGSGKAHLIEVLNSFRKNMEPERELIDDLNAAIKSQIENAVAADITTLLELHTYLADNTQIVKDESSDWIAERLRKLLPKDDLGVVKIPESLQDDLQSQLQNVALKIKELNKSDGIENNEEFCKLIYDSKLVNFSKCEQTVNIKRYDLEDNCLDKKSKSDITPKMYDELNEEDKNSITRVNSQPQTFKLHSEEVITYCKEHTNFIKESAGRKKVLLMYSTNIPCDRSHLHPEGGCSRNFLEGARAARLLRIIVLYRFAAEGTDENVSIKNLRDRDIPVFKVFGHPKAASELVLINVQAASSVDWAYKRPVTHQKCPPDSEMIKFFRGLTCKEETK